MVNNQGPAASPVSERPQQDLGFGLTPKPQGDFSEP